MRKMLIVISILAGLFVLGSLNSQKVFAEACGNGCGCYSGSCPSDRPDDIGNPGGQCQIPGQKVCCSPSCPGNPTETPTPTPQPTNPPSRNGCDGVCDPNHGNSDCQSGLTCQPNAHPGCWGSRCEPLPACTPLEWSASSCSRCNSSGTGWEQSGSDWGTYDGVGGLWCGCASQYSGDYSSSTYPQCFDTIPTPSINPLCTCDTGDVCNATNCTFDKFTDVNYISPLKCSLSSSLFPTPPTDKNTWCQRGLRTKGDADGNGVINNTDYFYYVAVVNGGQIPATVNPDFNGDGEVGATDRTIVTKSLNP